MKSVRVVNASKGVVIAQKADCAFSLGQRLQGLLGRSRLATGQGMVLKPCSSIHTILMRFSIDVIFLDQNMKIVKTIQNMPPNRLSPIVWGSRLAIEFPAGQISQTKTQVGDRIEFGQV